MDDVERRRVLQALAVTGALVWTVPIVDTIDTGKAYASVKGSPPPTTEPPTEITSPPQSPPTTGATTSPGVHRGVSTGQSLPYTGNNEEREAIVGGMFLAAGAMGIALSHYHGERRGV